uniref:Uncharacterized protein n=1 Tax=Romanomermis culicivorax TaxID=13658 RepID=A0A915L1B8_ROMCU
MEKFKVTKNSKGRHVIKINDHQQPIDDTLVDENYLATGNNMRASCNRAEDCNKTTEFCRQKPSTSDKVDVEMTTNTAKEKFQALRRKFDQELKESSFGKPICNPNAFTSKISKPKPSNNESQKTNNYQKVLENDLSLVRNGSSLPNNEREQETTDYFPSNKIGTIIERTSSRSSSCPSLRDMDNFQRMMKQKSAMDRNHSDHQIFSDDIDMIYANRGKESYFLQSPNFHLNQNRRTVSRKTAVPQTGKRNVRFNNNDFEDQKRDSFGHLPHQITYYRENCIDDHAIHHQYQRRNPNLHNTYHTNTNNEELRLSMDNPAFVEDPLSEEYKNGTAKSLNRVNYHHWSRNYETENDDYCKIFVISIVFLVGMIVLTAVGLFLSVYYDK